MTVFEVLWDSLGTTVLSVFPYRFFLLPLLYAQL